jgi:glycogen synthase
MADRPLRVLFWSEDFRPALGGVQVLASELLRTLSQRGFEFLVIAHRDAEVFPAVSDYDGVLVHRFRFWHALAEKELTALQAMLEQVAALKRRFRPDVIHLNGVRYGVMLHHGTRRASTAPTLVSLHETFEDRYTQRDTVFESTLRSAEWITACSTAVLEKTRQQVPGITSRSSVIPNALQMPELPPATLVFDPPRLLCVGRLVPDKGFDLALEAFAAVLRRFPSARLIVAGDGPARPDLEARADELGIRRAVEFLGWVDPEAVAALMNRASLVVMPSRQEPFGLVALQAAQLGRPIVATRVGGLPEVVLHDETGLLVPTDDPSALASAISSLLSEPERARQLGAAARGRASTVFDWDRCANAYADLYQRLASGGGAGQTAAASA